MASCSHRDPERPASRLWPAHMARARGRRLPRVDDYGIGSHYVVDDVNVHDVTGCDCFKAETEDSAGILFKAAGSSVPTGFDGIQVAGDTVSGVDGVGIGTVSQWSRRALYPAGTGTFIPMYHVHIFGNTLSTSAGTASWWKTAPIRSSSIMWSMASVSARRNHMPGFLRTIPTIQ